MNAEELLDELRTFRLHDGAGDQLASVGAPEVVASVDGAVASSGESVAADSLEIDGTSVPRVTNEFWTKQQRRGHSLHELSYRACFKSELPSFFIQRLTVPGDVVFDPFMGRGTTLLEAALQGRVAWGNDINPLSRILVEPRLEPPRADLILERIEQLDLEASPAAPEAETGADELSVFFHEETLRALTAMRARFSSDDVDATDRWLRMVATNRLTGHSPGFFSVRTMPPNQAVSVESQRKLNEKHERVPPRRDVREILRRKTKALLRDHDMFSIQTLATVSSAHRFWCHDARELDAMPSGQVQLIVTSPPFLDVVDYAADNWLRCWFNGLDAREISQGITCPSRVEDWQEFVQATFVGLERILKPGGWIVFEVGEVRGGKVRLEEVVVPAARAAGLKDVVVAIHAQDFTKTANCWGVTNNAKGTNTNRLVILQKEA